jgi:hypothetical protein
MNYTEKHIVVDNKPKRLYNMFMLKRVLISLIVVALIVLASRAYDAQHRTIPKEFVVNWIYDGVWKSRDNNYIYKTVGHRGEDIFVSSLCKNNEDTPTISSTGNEFTATDYYIVMTNSGLTMSVVTSNNKCFPVGVYNRIK